MIYLTERGISRFVRRWKWTLTAAFVAVPVAFGIAVSAWWIAHLVTWWAYGLICVLSWAVTFVIRLRRHAAADR